MTNVVRRPGRIIAALPLVFSLWTLFVWGGRLRNLWQEPGPLADVSRWSLIGSIVFCVLGLAVLALWSVRRGSGALRVAVAGLAVFTTGVWLVRAVDIAAGDHSLGFIVVHVVLAAVSIGLAVLAWLAVRPRTGRGNRQNEAPEKANVTGEPRTPSVR